jgi:hypothetical protein
MTQEALRMALEALENGDVPTPKNVGKNLDAITAIKEALAQTQEPVAWKLPDKNVVFWEDTKEVDEYHGFKPTIPLYTTPPPRTWVGLTDDEVAQAMYRADAIFTGPMQFKFAKEIEAKLKEKNT